MLIDQNACPATLPVMLRVQSAEQLEADPRILSKVMAWAQLEGLGVCPNATSIRLTGLAGSTVVYQGFAMRRSEWTLSEGNALAVQKGGAVGRAVPDARTLPDTSSSYGHAEADETAQTLAAPARPRSRVASMPVEVDFPGNGFRFPAIVEGITTGALDDIPNGEAFTKQYLIVIAENIGSICESNFSDREIQHLKTEAALSTAAPSVEGGAVNLMNALRLMAEAKDNPQKFTREHSDGIDEDHLFKYAMDDTKVLFKQYPCKSAKLDRFSDNLKKFVLNEGAPVLSTKQSLNLCVSNAQPTHYKKMDFCLCFEGAVQMAGISRGRRKDLQTNFWPTAQSLMREDPTDFKSCRDGLEAAR